jgi:hypothetical protein
MTGLHNKPQGCGCVRSIYCGALLKKTHNFIYNEGMCFAAALFMDLAVL